MEALTELFSGRSVVCNTVGPFERFGEPVVQAALAAGVADGPSPLAGPRTADEGQQQQGQVEEEE